VVVEVEEQLMLRRDKWVNQVDLVEDLVGMEAIIHQIEEQEIRHQHPHHKEIMEELLLLVGEVEVVLEL
jgi:hypothetical protein